VSHSVLLKVQKQIGEHFNSELVKAVTDGKTFRIIGDNVNFMIKASHQRKDKAAKEMAHWFVSAAIIQTGDFHSLSNERPQTPLMDL
jgi:hypothetical protein